LYESFAWAFRGFFVDCGTHLIFKFKEISDYNLPIKLFRLLRNGYAIFQRQPPRLLLFFKSNERNDESRDNGVFCKKRIKFIVTECKLITANKET
jgi:hypothetical protein